MPKLQGVWVEVRSHPDSDSDIRQMIIKSKTRSCLDKWKGSEELLLLVAFHTPSSSAISVWEDTSLHTKHMQLVAKFLPAPTIDENGVRRHKKWQDWEE